MIDATAYGKVADSLGRITIFMEWKYWLKAFTRAIPYPEYTDNKDFMNYCTKEGRQGDYTTYIMATLPHPRSDYYSSPDFKVTKQRVLNSMEVIVKKLGTYIPHGEYELLLKMFYFSYGILMIGLVFGIMLIMFVMISVLLIYSLLMINIETKTFEIGVMRLMGLSGRGFVAMIFVQSITFVFPSIVCAFVCVVPCLWAIFSKI